MGRTILLHSCLLLHLFAGNAVAAFLPSPNHSGGAATKSHHRSIATTSLNVGSIFESPRALVGKGMQSFRDYDVPSSLAYFDRADAAVSDGSLKPFLWQRGISYYYLDRYKEGSDQFRLDVSVNPLDVEEIVWDIACLARMENDEGEGGGASKFPPERRMALPAGRKDRRKIMSTVYSLYRGDGMMEYDLRKAGHEGNISDFILFGIILRNKERNDKGRDLHEGGGF